MSKRADGPGICVEACFNASLAFPLSFRTDFILDLTTKCK